jgi:3'(2'), 5'-bisphosphate nucleotidase
MEHMIEDLLKTVLKAGAVIMEVYSQDFEVLTKGDSSPVTLADQKGEAIIATNLARIAPHIPMVGEEAASEGNIPDISNGIFWLVDPLDGTKEFIHRRGDFTVNIGLIEDKKPMMGIVYAPDKGRIWWGIKGVGAWAADVKDDEIINRTPIKTRAIDLDDLVIVASKSHRSPELESWLEHYPDAEHISVGSSLKFCLLAEGKADLYPRHGLTCEWDTAAAHAVLVAAGGKVDADDGAALTYAKNTKTFLNPWFMAVADSSFNPPNLNSKKD